MSREDTSTATAIRLADEFLETHQAKLKPYGWGVVNKDGDTITCLAVFPTKEKAEAGIAWGNEAGIKYAPYRVVQLFYKEEGE